MQVTFSCPTCRATSRVECGPATTSVQCTQCAGMTRVTAGAVTDSEVLRCLVCPSTELFLRKNFPQRLGVAIVTVGFAASCLAWYFHMILTTFAILFLTALIDLVLYLVVGDVVECYRCHAQYSHVPDMKRHASFDLEIHERHRQGRARLAEAEAEGRTKVEGRRTKVEDLG